MTVWVKLHVNVFPVGRVCESLYFSGYSTYASRCAIFGVVGVTIWVDKLVNSSPIVRIVLIFAIFRFSLTHHFAHFGCCKLIM